jgi:hypothetical protein
MQISRGKIIRPQRVVNYGPEGIGKSTFASHFPNPVFIDVEQGTAHLDIARTPTPASYTMLRQLIESLTRDAQGYNTLVIDTADWAERLTIMHICSQNNMASLGGLDDYGKSYNLLAEEWAKFLDSLTNLSLTQGIHIVILAHAQMRKFELPEEAGKFDRWELKLERKTGALLKEWPDMLLFATYKTMVVDIKKTKKAQGGERILRTTHHPCWDAKNRHSLPPELPYEFKSIAHALSNATPATQPPAQPEMADITPEGIPLATPGVPTSLIQLMETSKVTELQLRQAVASRGHYPVETPITNYTSEFIEGNLVAAWPRVLEVINELRTS